MREGNVWERDGERRSGIKRRRDELKKTQEGSQSK